jgi:multiple sugar transport system permease protein
VARSRGVTARRRRWGRLTVHRTLTAWGFLLGPLILFGVIFLFPAVRVVHLSTLRSQLFRPEAFVGLGNFQRLVDDPLFWKSLGITATWAVGVVPAVVLIALPLALVLNTGWLRAKGLWRLVFFLPVVTNIVAAAFVWRWLFDPQFGVVNYGLGLLSLPRPGWLAVPGWALAAMMIVAVWKQVGQAMVLFLAGLQTIPKEFEEAAAIDGANALQMFRFVTLPLLNPTLVFVAAILLINAFRVFTIPFVMSSGGLTHRTVGGPLDSTRLYVLHLYDWTFSRFDFGYGAATAVVLLVIVVILTLLQTKVLSRPFEY